MSAEPTSNHLYARTRPPCIHQTQPYDLYALLYTYTHPAYDIQRPARNYSQPTTSLALSELYIITPDVISCTTPPLCSCDFLTSREKAISLTTMTWGTHHPHRIEWHCIASPLIDLVPDAPLCFEISGLCQFSVSGCPRVLVSSPQATRYYINIRFLTWSTGIPIQEPKHLLYLRSTRFSWVPTADLQPAPDRSQDCLLVSTLPEQTPG